MSLVRQLAGAIGVLLVLSGPALAAHPLITDDTGTQGKGRWQVETTGGYGNAIVGGITFRF